MSSRFIYLIGAPGSGKSTVAAILRAHAATYELHDEPVPHLVMVRGGLPWYAEIGVLRTNFAGTDGLAMDIIGKAEAWIATRPYRRLFAEGDRLANTRFFAAVNAAGYELTVAYLYTPQAVLDARRNARAVRVGKAQNASWLRGRDSKVARLATLVEATALDGTAAPGITAATLKNLLG